MPQAGAIYQPTAPQKPPAPHSRPAGGGASKPHGNVMQFVRNIMGGRFNPAQAANMPSLGDTVKGLGKLAMNVTGVSDGMDALQKLIQGDVIGAFKSGIKAQLKFALLLVTLPAALKKFSESILESRRELQHYNGSIAAAFGRLDMQQFRLNVRTGAATAGSTTALADSVMRLRENTQAIRELKTNVVNIIGTSAAMFADRIASKLNVIAEAAAKWLAIPQGQGRVPGQRFVDDLAGGRGLPQKDRLPGPGRFGGRIPGL